jgi:hypothetical protein
MRAPQSAVRNGPTVIGEYFLVKLYGHHARVGADHQAWEPIGDAFSGAEMTAVHFDWLADFEFLYGRHRAGNPNSGAGTLL